MTQTLTAKVIPRDLLRISDLDEHQFEHLLYQAACMKARPFEYRTQLPGRMISCYFEKPSTRTRVSFAGAAAPAGDDCRSGCGRDELQLGRGEPIADTARVLAGYSAAIVVRTFDQAVVQQIAAASDGAGDQRAHRRAPPLPGARRLPDAARALRRAPRACGSPTSATATTSPGR